MGLTATCDNILNMSDRIEFLIARLEKAKQELAKNVNQAYIGSPNTGALQMSEQDMDKQEGVGMMRAAPPVEGKIHHVKKKKKLKKSQEDFVREVIGEHMEKGAKEFWQRHKDKLVAPALAATTLAGNYAPTVVMPAAAGFGDALDHGKGFRQAVSQARETVDEVNRAAPGGVAGAMYRAYKDRNSEVVKYDSNGQWKLVEADKK